MYSIIIWLTYFMKWLPQEAQWTSIIWYRYNIKETEMYMYFPFDENSQDLLYQLIYTMQLC